MYVGVYQFKFCMTVVCLHVLLLHLVSSNLPFPLLSNHLSLMWILRCLVLIKIVLLFLLLELQLLLNFMGIHNHGLQMCISC